MKKKMRGRNNARAMEREREGERNKKKIKRVSCHEKLMVTSIKVFAFTSKMSRYK